MMIEFAILDWLQTLHSGVLDKIMIFITTLGNSGAVWIALAAVLLIIPKTRPVGVAVALALILDLITCNLMIKPLVARTRPYEINTAVELLINKPHDYSFPSGHSAASFAAASAMFFAGTKPRLWVPAVVLGALIAFSRLYLYVHFPTDVLGGIVLGIALGAVSVFIIKKFYHVGHGERLADKGGRK